MMFAKVAPASHTYDTPPSRAHSCQYMADDSSKTVSELLSDEPKLLGYAQRLEEAELDAQTVAELGLTELREVLHDAPIAHCLQLRACLAASTKLRPIVPDAPAWK